MTSPRLARVALSAALLVGGLTLTACGVTNPSNAAIVGNERISTSTLQQAADQLAAAGATPQTTLNVLVIGHFATKEAARIGQGVSQDQAEQYLKQRIHIKDPNPATVEVIRRALATQVVQQYLQQHPKAAQQFTKDLHDTTITINPRYGHFDPKTGSISQQTPNWIKATSGSSTGSTPGQ